MTGKLPLAADGNRGLTSVVARHLVHVVARHGAGLLSRLVTPRLLVHPTQPVTAGLAAASATLELGRVKRAILALLAHSVEDDFADSEDITMESDDRDVSNSISRGKAKKVRATGGALPTHSDRVFRV